MRKISKEIVYSRDGSTYTECWIGLNVGDKLLCIDNTIASKYVCLTVGRVYTVFRLALIDNKNVAHIIDNGCLSCLVTTDRFSIIKDKFEKRIDKIAGLIEE